TLVFRPFRFLVLIAPSTRSDRRSAATLPCFCGRLSPLNFLSDCPEATGMPTRFVTITYPGMWVFAQLMGSLPQCGNVKARLMHKSAQESELPVTTGAEEECCNQREAADIFRGQVATAGIQGCEPFPRSG